MNLVVGWRCIVYECAALLQLHDSLLFLLPRVVLALLQHPPRLHFLYGPAPEVFTDRATPRSRPPRRWWWAALLGAVVRHRHTGRPRPQSRRRHGGSGSQRSSTRSPGRASRGFESFRGVIRKGGVSFQRRRARWLCWAAAEGIVVEDGDVEGVAVQKSGCLGRHVVLGWIA